MNVIGSKWIYETKLRSDGSIESFKAPLVAQGYSQIFGLDFDENFFTPVLNQQLYVSFFLLLLHVNSLYIK